MRGKGKVRKGRTKRRKKGEAEGRSPKRTALRTALNQSHPSAPWSITMSP